PAPPSRPEAGRRPARATRAGGRRGPWLASRSGRARAVPALAAGVAIAVGRSALAVSGPDQVRLELVEEAAPALAQPERRQPVPGLAPVVDARFRVAVLDQCGQDVPHRGGVAAEPQGAGDAG